MTAGTSVTKGTVCARPISSDATTRADVFRHAGSVTVITIVETAATKQIAARVLRFNHHQFEQLQEPVVRPLSLDAGATADVFRQAGSATAIMTAQITAMNKTARGNKSLGYYSSEPLAHQRNADMTVQNLSTLFDV